MRVLSLGKILLHRHWQVLRKNSYSWIPLWSFTEVPISMVPVDLYSSFLPGLLPNFGLVNADNIRLWLLKVILEILFPKDRPDAIHVPRWNQQLLWGFTVPVLPICLIWLAMDNVRSITKLLWSRLRRFRLDKLFGKQLCLFLFLLFDYFLLWLWFLIVYFWRHINIYFSES